MPCQLRKFALAGLTTAEWPHPFLSFDRAACSRFPREMPYDVDQLAVSGDVARALRRLIDRAALNLAESPGMLIAGRDWDLQRCRISNAPQKATVRERLRFIKSQP